MTAGDEGVARVEELTMRFLDGAADAAEKAELADLVEADAGARDLHLRLIEVEVALRGGRPAQVAPAVLEQLARERADRAVRAVMEHVTSMTPIQRGPRARARRWPALLALAAAAAVIAGLWWGTRAPGTASRPAPRVMGRAAAPPAPVETVTGAINVMADDFEAGELPEGLIDGERATGMCAPRSQRCLVGTAGEYDPESHTITLERFRPPLFSYAPNQVLSFDYRVGPDAPGLRVQAWSRDRRANFRIVLRDLIPDRWAHAEVRLQDLRGYSDRGPLEPGDAVSNIMFVAGRRPGAPFYLDNLRVTEYPEDASLPTTSAAIPVE